MQNKIFIIVLTLFFGSKVFAQDSLKQKMIAQNLFNNSVSKKDSIPVSATDSSALVIKKDSAVIFQKDSIVTLPKHDPHKATIYSLMLPGLGQAYNHEYWKIPIVYAAISIPVVTFIYNNNWYHRTRDAFNILVANDTPNFKNIYYRLQPFITNPYGLQDLQNFRNSFRKDRDYSILFFLLAWGLNVVDATVFGNLKDFDVSDNISMNVSPTFNSTTKTAALGFVFNFKTPEKKIINFGK